MPRKGVGGSSIILGTFPKCTRNGLTSGKKNKQPNFQTPHPINVVPFWTDGRHWIIYSLSKNIKKIVVNVCQKICVCSLVEILGTEIIWLTNVICLNILNALFKKLKMKCMLQFLYFFKLFSEVRLKNRSLCFGVYHKYVNGVPPFQIVWAFFPFALTAGKVWEFPWQSHMCLSFEAEQLNSRLFWMRRVGETWKQLTG